MCSANIESSSGEKKKNVSGNVPELYTSWLESPEHSYCGPQLAEDEKFGVVIDPSKPWMTSHSRTVGDHVRRKISGAKKQIQYAAKQGFPSVLVIYNNIDPLHLFGTEDMDFIAALYGELTISMVKGRTAVEAVSEPYQGRNQSLSEIKNTSFSAVGHLRPYTGKMTLTLFENVFSKAKISYEQLPPCFEVKRVMVSNEPLVLRSTRS